MPPPRVQGVRILAVLALIAGPAHAALTGFLFMLAFWALPGTLELVAVLATIASGFAAALTGLIALTRRWTSRWFLPWCWITIGLALTSCLTPRIVLG